MTHLRLSPLDDRLTPAAGFAAFGAAPGGLPLVGVFNGGGAPVAQFAAFEQSFTGGVRVATGELDGDPNTQDVVAVAGPGGGPVVKVFAVDVRTGAVTQRASFLAFEPGFRGGLHVAIGDVLNRNAGVGQIVLGAGEGGGPRVRVVNADGSGVGDSPLADFFAYEPTFRGGVQVAAGELDGNPNDGDELVAAAGTGGGPRVRVFRSDGATLVDYFAFGSSFRGGANVTVRGNGLTGQLLVDAYALDPSQRSVSLNTAAVASAQTLTAGTGATNLGGATTATGLTGVTSATGLSSTTATGVSTQGLTTAVGQATGGGGITQATGTGGFGTLATTATGLTSQITGAGGFSTQTTGTTVSQATGATGLTTTAGGVSAATAANGLSVNTLTGGGVAVTTFAFGPFGDPGPANPTPAFANPPYAPGTTRYAIVV